MIREEGRERCVMACWSSRRATCTPRGVTDGHQRGARDASLSMATAGQPNLATVDRLHPSFTHPDVYQAL
jgi:hypothetical protein